jgi:hypothetical protein
MACEGLNRGIFVDAAFPVNGGLRLDDFLPPGRPLALFSL